MSKVTDRLDNKHIIELAKQNYEQKKQTSKFPANIINLPSAGKVYAEDSVLRSGKIEMRHMTAYDEDILSNSSYIKENIVFDKLLEALIVTPGVDINELLAGDKEWVIISARILGYGSEYNVTISDNKNAVLDLSKLKTKTFNQKDNGNGLFDYTIQSNGDVIKFKYLSMHDANKLNENSLNSEFLKASIKQVNDITDESQIDEYLKYELRALDSRKLRKHIIETAPGLNYNTTVVSDDGGTHDAMFQFDVKLFWF